MNQLHIWTVYQRPSDYPNHYVARLFTIGAGGITPTNTVLLANTLQKLRSKLPAGLHKIPRYPDDDPNIIEVWL